MTEAVEIKSKNKNQHLSYFSAFICIKKQMILSAFNLQMF